MIVTIQLAATLLAVNLIYEMTSVVIKYSGSTVV